MDAGQIPRHARKPEEVRSGQLPIR